MSQSSILEQKIKHIESDIAEIKREVKEIPNIRIAVERIETKLDERAQAANQRFDDQDRRINRLGFRFWSMIAGIGVIIVGYRIKSI